jgi:hypothetical protein
VRRRADGRGARDGERVPYAARVRFAFDHAVITVPFLASAEAAFRAAGFTVTAGGRHDVLPTENALVAFADGAYLELLALRDDDARESIRLLRASPGWDAHVRSASAVARRFLPRLAGAPGVGDAALRGTRLARFAAESRRRGFAMTGPVPMRRQGADGEALEWDLLLPADDALPFFIEDRTPLDRRVPSSPEAVTHANGATGVAALQLRAPGVPDAAMAWAELFDAAPRVAPDGGAVLELPRLRVAIGPGGPAGACGVTLRGVAVLPPDIEALGVSAGGGG